MAANLNERARWKRSTVTRWDERRLAAYVSYAAVLKEQTRLCVRIGTSLGIGPTSSSPLDPSEGMRLLAQTEDRRSVLLEDLLLLGDTATIEAARQWRLAVAELRWLVHGLTPVSGHDFAEAYERAGELRARFYERARQSLGVLGDAPSRTPDGEAPLW